MAKKYYQDSVSQQQKDHFSKFLAEDEELVLLTGFSKLYLRQKMIIFILLPGAAFILGGVILGWWLKWDLAYSLLGGLIVAMLFAYVKMRFMDNANKYLLTTRRLIIKRGFFAVELSSALFDKITHIEVKQGFIDKYLMHHGTIIVNTAGMNKDAITLKFVDQPIAFKNILERLINREREQFSRQTGPVVTLEGEVVED